MRISFRARADVTAFENDQPIQEPELLAGLHGWKFEDDAIGNYLDFSLVDAGIIGGLIRAEFQPEDGVSLIVDYWSPVVLDDEMLEALQNETQGQLSDGMGEGGFEIQLGETQVNLSADTDTPLTFQQIEDGIPVTPPSKVVRAARMGDMPALQQALEAGDDIDAKSQGYTGLHLSLLYGHAEAAKLLVERGASVDLLDKHGTSPLHLCALARDISDQVSAELASMLLQRGSNPIVRDETRNTPLDLALNRKKAELASVLRMWEERAKFS